MEISLTFLLILILVMLITFEIGSNDAILVNGFSSSLDFKKLIWFGALFYFLGVLVFSWSYKKTVGGRMLLISPDLMMIILSLVSSIFIMLLAIIAKFPLSVTQGMVTSLVTLSVLYNGLESTNRSFLVFMLGVWMVGPLVVFFSSMSIGLMLDFILKRRIKNLHQLETWERRFNVLLLITLSMTLMLKTGNDVGIFLAIVPIETSFTRFLFATWLAILYLVGFIFLGKKMLLKYRIRVDVLKPRRGFSGLFSASLFLLLANVGGMPLSVVQIMLSSFMGSTSRSIKSTRSLKFYFKMYTQWMLSIPFSVLVAISVYLLVIVLPGIIQNFFSIFL